MFTKIKTWFVTNWKNFGISFIILVLLDIVPLATLPKWALIIGTILIYLGILTWKIWKNQPF